MRLSAGPWELVAAPERGGAILSLTRGGRDILRPTPAGTQEPFDLACFPLVPYANRIAFGTFAWEDRTHHLPRNHEGQAHPLHGTGWLSAWQVMARDAASVTLSLSHPANAGWPWAFTATQSLSLSAQGLSAELSITNSDRRAMPVSLGFHPYFAKAGARSLGFAAQGVWLADEEMLPTVLADADRLGDWAGGGALERAELIDHCYTGWDGVARIGRDDGDVMLTAQGAPALHVYLPPGEAFFCAEPVSAMPDAVNRDAAAMLLPGASQRISMTIRSA